ncbi:MAG: hypothetical protein B6241_13010 [Spirochaetaceae bacterium 4572_59]|nr:MAG: hypothetical protein B6241_13010 [Spirochaetaceae bacterium 4572_59]
MYTVFLADDEPSALSYLRTLISQKCSGFSIIGEADNGKDALQMVGELKPDLLISDIRMPIMDGIELIGEVKKHYPEIQSVIVSGYQDFQYAQKALQSGVSDYLLKPVKISDFTELMDKINQELGERRHKNIRQMLNDLLLSEETGTGNHAEQIMPRKLHISVIRKNGFPAHINPSLEFLNYSLPLLDEEDRLYTWLLRGRDENELIIVSDGCIVTTIHFKELINNISRQFKGDGYSTNAIKTECNIKNFLPVVSKLYKLIGENTIPGSDQSLDAEAVNPQYRNRESHVNSSLLIQIETLINREMFENTLKELEELFSLWEKEKLPLINMEIELTRISHIILRKYPEMDRKNIELTEKLATILKTGRSHSEIGTAYITMIKEFHNSLPEVRGKIDSIDFFHSIDRYLDSHIAEDLSLCLICSIFGISQSSLSKLFRKYSNRTYTEYLTETRINKSIAIMGNSHRMPLKEIAPMVGYNDPLYFSKVFKAVKKMSPRSYMENQMQENT